MKLPQYMRHKWTEHAVKIRSRRLSDVEFSDVVDFVKKAAEIANDPIFGKEAMRNDNAKPDHV